MSGDPTIDAPIPQIARHETELLSDVKSQIAASPEIPDDDRDELIATVERIEREMNKSDALAETRLLHWLEFLAEFSPDIFEITASALLSLPGVAPVTKKILHRMEEERK